jgi:hypothetical protein
VARCKLGPKKVRRLAAQTGLDVVTALTRGGTDHRIDLFCADGSRWHLLRDGRLVREGEIGLMELGGMTLRSFGQFLERTIPDLHGKPPECEHVVEGFIPDGEGGMRWDGKNDGRCIKCGKAIY